MRFIFSLSFVQLRTLSCISFIASLSDYSVIDFSTDSRFTSLSVLYFSQKADIFETIFVFRLERLFSILFFAIRRLINTILNKEFVSVSSKQYIAIQQILDLLSSSTFSLFDSLLNFFSDNSSSESDFDNNNIVRDISQFEIENKKFANKENLFVYNIETDFRLVVDIQYARDCIFIVLQFSYFCSK